MGEIVAMLAFLAITSLTFGPSIISLVTLRKSLKVFNFNYLLKGVLNYLLLIPGLFYYFTYNSYFELWDFILYLYAIQRLSSTYWVICIQKKWIAAPIFNVLGSLALILSTIHIENTGGLLHGYTVYSDLIIISCIDIILVKCYANHIQSKE